MINELDLFGPDMPSRGFDDISKIYEDTVKLLCTTAESTRITYQKCWEYYSQWCEKKGVSPTDVKSPEGLLAFFITDLTSSDKYKPNTILKLAYGICYVYRSKGFDVKCSNPVIRKTLTGMVRALRDKALSRKKPITTDMLKALVDGIALNNIHGIPRLAGYRDRTVLIIALVGAFRASEIVSIQYEDLEKHRDGYLIHLRHSKTDQRGRGMTKIVPYGANPSVCPVRALEDWLKISGITEGNLFPVVRHNQLTNEQVKAYTYRIFIKELVENTLGIDPSEYSGHSLRAGFVTSAAERDVPEYLIMEQTGHKSLDHMQGYIRLGKSFKSSAASRIGL